MKKIFIKPIVWYKKYISPLLPNSCRYYPTCSEYMMIAIEKHGVIKGIIMGIFRIFRCNPFCKPGYDYVPDRFSIKRNKLIKKEKTNE